MGLAFSSNVKLHFMRSIAYSNGKYSEWNISNHHLVFPTQQHRTLARFKAFYSGKLYYMAAYVLVPNPWMHPWNRRCQQQFCSHFIFCLLVWYTRTTGATQQTTAEMEKVQHHAISAACSGEEWSYFVTCWEDYFKATKLTGKGKVVPLQECCDKQLWKDLA